MTKWTDYLTDLEKKFEKMKEEGITLGNEYVILKHIVMLGCHLDKVIENQEKIMNTQKEQAEAIAVLMEKVDKKPEVKKN